MSLVSVADDLRYIIDTVNSEEGQGGYLGRGRVGGWGNTEILRQLMKILTTPVRRQASTNTLIQVVQERGEGLQERGEGVQERGKVQETGEIMQEKVKVINRKRDLQEDEK